MDDCSVTSDGLTFYTKLFLESVLLTLAGSAGYLTLSQLAEADPNALPKIPYLGEKKLAVLQAQCLVNGVVHCIENEPLPVGTYIHFDIESDPLTSTCITEAYLWGFLLPSYFAEDFEYVWQNNGESDHDCWGRVLKIFERYREALPDVRFVHYAHHERTTIKQYAKRFGDENNPIVLWLLDENGPLFDLYRYVTRNFLLPVYSYTLKTICKHRNLVNFRWELEESGSQWSVVRYHDYIASLDKGEDASIKEEILTYNRDDVRATAALIEWIAEQG